jgi:aldehyde:ferredoxin oxidoreductase
VGERVNNLARVFNISAGFTRADDTFPKRIIDETIKEGGSSGQRISQEDLELMLNEYYEARNWSPDGVPSREKLAELDLPEAAALLAARGLLADD